MAEQRLERNATQNGGGAGTTRCYRYVGLAMPQRKGQECECLVWPPARAAKKNALVRFADGTLVVLPARTLRRLAP